MSAAMTLAPSSSKALGDAAPEPGGRAGDDRDLACELHRRPQCPQRRRRTGILPVGGEARRFGAIGAGADRCRAPSSREEKNDSSSSASRTMRSDRVPLDVGVEHRGVERALELIALELRHVDAIGGEAAQRLVERGRHVAHAEDEGRDDRRLVWARHRRPRPRARRSASCCASRPRRHCARISRP